MVCLLQLFVQLTHACICNVCVCILLQLLLTYEYSSSVECARDIGITGNCYFM